MRVLVTGHQGYLGTVMVPILQAAGHDVTGLDSGFFADCVLGPAPQDPPGMQVDLRDVTSEQLEGFEAVIHLAALSNDPLGALAPQITYDINHHASVRLARLAKEAGVRRFLYASTCSVYGAAGEDLVTERCSVTTADPVRGEQGPRGGRRRRDRGRLLLAGVPAQRHRVRVLAASARGHRAEQSGRSCGPHRRRSSSVGRHTVASAGARP